MFHTATQEADSLWNTCGVELDYKFFSEIWKIFNEVTLPSYKLRNALPVEPQSDENLYQTSLLLFSKSGKILIYPFWNLVNLT